MRLSCLAYGPLAALLALSGCSHDDPPLLGADNGEDEPRRGDAGANDGKRPDAKADARASTGNDTPTGKPTQPDDGTNKCAGIRKDAPEAQGGVDVIFVIDTSGSMAPEIAQVQMNMERFMRDFEGSKADTHVTLITLQNLAAGTSLETDSTRYRFVPSPVDSKALFSVALATFPAYQDFMRPNAATQFVMVTDDEDAIPSDTFHQQMQTLLGHDLTQHAIASEDNNGFPCSLPGANLDPLCVGPIPVVCTATSVGRQYYTLADTTGGEKISICADDWTAVFDRLRDAVIAGVPLPCDFPLADATHPDFDPALVQVVFSQQDQAEQEFPKASSSAQCADRTGWYYDDESAPKSLSLCPAACQAVAQGGAIDIAFGCKPQVFL